MLLLASCKPAPAEEFHYAFLFPRGDVPSDAVLMFGDVELGPIEPAASAGSEEARTYAHVYAILPRSAGLVSAAPDKLAARRRTAAGETLVPIKVLDGQLLHANKSNDWRWSAELEQQQRQKTDEREPESRHHFPIVVPIDWAGEAPGDSKAPSVVIVVDDHGASPPPRIMIGSLEVKRGQVFETQGLTPGQSYPVKAGDELLGTLEVKPRAPAYLISTKPACYTERLITYAGPKDTGGGPSGVSKVHGPGKIFPLVHRPDHFLEKAPSSVRGSGPSFTVAEVTESPCP